MARYIDADELYILISEMEEIARERAINTPTNSPCYTRYNAQLNERTAMKHVITDAPTVDAAPAAHGVNKNETYAGCDEFICSVCEIHLDGWTRTIIDYDEDNYDFINQEYVFNYCPNCGAKLINKDISQ